MAKAYIANKPVRFDRNYAVGEVIPDGVVTPQMGHRLVEMGRILCVDIPNSAPEIENETQFLPDGTEPEPQEGGEFICNVCGKAFKSQPALAAHCKSHKE